MCLYLYIHNKYTQHTHILCKQKCLFWMRLITINHLTALTYNTHTHLHINEAMHLYNFSFFIFLLYTVFNKYCVEVDQKGSSKLS